MSGVSGAGGAGGDAATGPVPLSGRVALITGCGRRRGIGAGIAGALARRGCGVVVSDLPTDGLEQVAAMVRDRFPDVTVATAPADLRQPAEITGAVSRVLDRFGRVDILVNNAAAPHGTDRGDPAGVTLTDLDDQLSVNVRAAFLLVQAVLPSMRALGRGRIVNVSSQAAKIGLPGRAVYSMTKAALLGLTRALAVDLGSDGITVNALCPGVVATDRLTDTASREDPSGRPLAPGAPTAPTAAGGTDAWARTVPVRRVGDPADIAEAVAYLVSDEASYVTGHALTVDGGRFPV